MMKTKLPARLFLLLLLAAGGLAAGLPAAAATFFVDLNNTSGIEDGSGIHPFRTIQGALRAASVRNIRLLVADPNIERDLLVTEIIVRPGAPGQAYRERVIIADGFSVRSLKAADPNCNCDKSEIYGGGAGPVVTIERSGSSTILEGFRITGGIASFGGGVYVVGGNPQVLDNDITGNVAVGSAIAPGGGGGIGITGDPTVEGNFIFGNQVVYGAGGGIAVRSGSPIIRRNTIQGNRALATTGAYSGYGGGIAVESTASFPLIASNLIEGNRADAGGGGIDVYRVSPFVANNTIANNVAVGRGALPGNGGGMLVLGSRGAEKEVSPSIVNNVFVGNVAGGSGGGLKISRARPVSGGNRFHDNRPANIGDRRSPIGIDVNTAGDPLFDPNAPFLFYPDASLGSPLIDGGSDGVLGMKPGPDGDPNTPEDNLYTRLVPLPGTDLPGSPRPVDATAAGRAIYDVGAYETMAGDMSNPDGDLIPEDLDADPNTSSPCTGGQVIGCDDNCPHAYNPAQEDLDGDLVGDACDNCGANANGPCDPNDVATHPLCDADGNGQTTADELDMGYQSDLDPAADPITGLIINLGDGLGDACDADRDNDGILEDGNGSGIIGDFVCRKGKTKNCDDNCLALPNGSQRDRDKDAVGDACDNCPAQPNGDCDLWDRLCDVNKNGTTTAAEIALGMQIDTDGDGFGDACDNCPYTANGICSYLDEQIAYCDMDIPPDGILTGLEVTLGSQADRDEDKIGDACDSDRDGDGIPNDLDGDPNTLTVAPSCTGGATTGCHDNCPDEPNERQADWDGDGVGYRCDNCVKVYNPGVCVGASYDPNIPTLCAPINSLGPCPGGQCLQLDRDADGSGDECDADDDNDGILDDGDGSGIIGDAPCVPDPSGSFSDCDDNCPFTFNSSQSNLDGDDKGDLCDDEMDGDMILPDGDDDDVPGANRCTGGITTDCDDNCSSAYNPGQEDADNDFVGDACDLCPNVPNTVQTDYDGDEIGDPCDSDLDGDGIPEDADGDPNTIATCAGGVSTGCDDNCRRLSNADQADADADAVGDDCDNCPDAYNPHSIDTDGDLIPDRQPNTDGDRFGDACDDDVDGDGIAEDGDLSGVIGDEPCSGTIPNDGCDDNCPLDRNPTQGDTDGDGIGDACDDDVDGDGSIDVDDNCPTLSNANQADADGDAVGDACDLCPGDPGLSNADADGDGLGDECDNCPAVHNPQQDASACAGSKITLKLERRGGQEPVVKAGSRVHFDTLATNNGITSERLDLRVILWKPSAEGFATPGQPACPLVSVRPKGAARVKAGIMDAFAGQESKRPMKVRIPSDARSGTWIITVEACPRGGQAALVAGLGVTVK